MEFGSIVFLLRFLPVFLICYYLVPGRMKNYILLLGNLCFFAWGMPLYILLLLLVLTSDYCHGLLIEKYRGKRAADILLGNALFFDGMILFIFGYADFAIQAVNHFFGTKWEGFGFPAPLGLTIFILQAMSYVLDVHRGRTRAQRNYLDYAVYVSLFPQLLGGPIVQYRKIVGSLHERKLQSSQISRGLKRFCIGLAKKVLIADMIAELWDDIVALGFGQMSLATAWLGILAFGFRLFYSFSGYADMAVGLADCLGFEYPENYRHPFAAGSVIDFMHRWNITLLRWMREYFFNSLAKESSGLIRQVVVMLFSCALIGLWYGPDGTFLLWGLWMAFFYVLEILFWKKVQRVLPYFVNWVLAMLVVSLGWVLFALNDFTDVWAYSLALFGQGNGGFLDDHFWYALNEYFWIVALGILFALPHVSNTVQKMRKSRRIMVVALYRFGEKTVPAILLLLSLLKVAGD